MGSQAKSIRRGICRNEVRRALFSTRLLGAGHTHVVRQAREVYVRFAAGPEHPDSRQQKGIFHASTVLWHDQCGMTDAQVHVLRAGRDWFNANLIAPDLDEPRAIFWFRADSAGECVSRLWARVALLRDAGIVVRMLRCTDPGRIVYRDAHQVAAIPQRHTRWRFKAL
jgi:hypothetical protein